MTNSNPTNNVTPLSPTHPANLDPLMSAPAMETPKVPKYTLPPFDPETGVAEPNFFDMWVEQVQLTNRLIRERDDLRAENEFLASQLLLKALKEMDND